MIFQIIPIRPNPRCKYQKQVETLCKLLIDEDGKYYRVPVFRLLSTTGKRFRRTGHRKFREYREAKLFLRNHLADIRALDIMSELDRIYEADPDETDHMRGAVGEVFAYYVCRKIHQRADIEVQVKVGTWTSRQSIDAAGCSQKRGHCLQSKYSLQYWYSIIEQKRDLDEIKKRTNGKAQGAFITYVHRRAFEGYLLARGVDTSTYKVFDRSDMLVLENLLSS